MPGRGLNARSPGEPPRPTPGLARALTGLARAVLTGYFRAVEVQGRANLPGGGPVLVVANHANGLLDPLLVVHGLDAMPRFVAKAGLWRVAAARPVLDRLGLLPVVRRQDRARLHASNADTFARAQRALADGATVAIFPEGTAHDEPHLLPLRSGAARLALGARAEGAAGLHIVPVGLVFDDKVALRSRALVVVGEAVALDRWLAQRGEPTVDDTDRRAVEDLTARIARSLTEVVPSADTVAEAWALARAASVVAADGADPAAAGGAPAGAGEPALSRSTAVARALGAAPEAARQRVRKASDGYRAALERAGLRDHDLVSAESSGRLVLRAVATGARTVVLAPWALFGATVNAVPYAVVRLAGRLAPKPAARGTLRVLAGAVAFPVTWVAAGAVAARRRSPVAGVAVAVAAALSGYAAVVEAERVLALRRAWQGRTARLGLRARADELLAARRHLLEVTGEALEATTESLLADAAR